jgi:hypothetical protein
MLSANAVLFGACFFSFAIPNAAALNHGVGQHRIDTDTVCAAFFGEILSKVNFGDFGDSIGDWHRRCSKVFLA